MATYLGLETQWMIQISQKFLKTRYVCKIQLKFSSCRVPVFLNLKTNSTHIETGGDTFKTCGVVLPNIWSCVSLIVACVLPALISRGSAGGASLFRAMLACWIWLAKAMCTAACCMRLIWKGDTNGIPGRGSE